MVAPHVLALPFPAQGHVTPLMQLSHRLVENGIEVTFVNTELNHALVLDALAADGTGRSLDGIHLVAVPDGLADGDDRKDLGKLVDGMSRHMPGYLEELVVRIEASGGTKINWLIADEGMGWAFEVAKKLGIRAACFWSGSAAFLATILRIPQMIQDGVIDEKGWPNRQETFEFAPGMPPLHTSQLPWNNAGAPEGQPAIFQLVIRNNAAKGLAEVTVCNSFRDAEPGAFELYPDILPIGPLFADRQFQKPVGQFLPEDTACLEWLDAQADRSAVYVAFGSFTVFNPRQFQELALGLELTGRPFLWVVRPDFWPEQSVARRVPGPRRRQGHDRELVPPATGAGAPCGGVLRVALRVELNAGRGAERRAVPVLALLHGPVPERELHLQRVEDRLGGGAGDRRRRDEGGAEQQIETSPRRRRDQGEGGRAQERCMQVHRRGRVVA